MRRRYILWLVAFLVVWLATGAAELIQLTGPDGQTVFINATQITSIRQPAASDLRHFAPTVRCIVVTSAGKFVAVRETCQQVATMAGWHASR